MEGAELPHELAASTRQLLHQAAEAFEAEELKATLADGQNLVSFANLDKATRIAVDSITRAVAEGQPEEIVSYCGSILLTGYLVGRAMLRTVGGALYFSNPLTEADYAGTMVRISTTDEADQIDAALRPTGDLFVKYAIEIANQAGPVSPLPEQVRVGLVGGSAVAGMRLAIIEHDLFAADRQDLPGMDKPPKTPQEDSVQQGFSMISEESPSVPTERVTQLRFVMAIKSVHEAMGLDDDFPMEAGAKVLLSLREYHRYGMLDSEAVVMGVVQSLNDLPQPHRKALGFGFLNKWPDRARAYVRRLLIEGVESEALPMTLEDAHRIASRI